MVLDDLRISHCIDDAEDYPIHLIIALVRMCS